MINDELSLLCANRNTTAKTPHWKGR